MLQNIDRRRDMPRFLSLSVLLVVNIIGCSESADPVAPSDLGYGDAGLGEDETGGTAGSDDGSGWLDGLQAATAGEASGTDSDAGTYSPTPDAGGSAPTPDAGSDPDAGTYSPTLDAGGDPDADAGTHTPTLDAGGDPDADAGTYTPTPDAGVDAGTAAPTPDAGVDVDAGQDPSDAGIEPECDEGEQREVDCGHDPGKGQVQVCVEGQWENDGGCFFEIPQTSVGFSIRWDTGETCECDDPPYDFNIYAGIANRIAFFWPRAFEEDEDYGGGVADEDGYYLVLGPGDTIGPESEFVIWADTDSTDAWQADVSGYLGFRFLNPETDEINYGYVHLMTTDPNGYPARLGAYAYNDDGSPITIP